jgi:hypothetical protein
MKQNAITKPGTSRHHLASQPPTPTHRFLRGYAFDPSLATQLSTALVHRFIKTFT